MKGKQFKQFLKDMDDTFDYDPKTGDFFWKERPREHFNTEASFSRFNKQFAFKKAGYLNDDGYIVLKFRNKPIFAHRMAWIYVTRTDPTGLIVDHDDQNKANNCFANLRLGTNKDNAQNKKRARNNTSGYIGVSHNKKTGYYEAYIHHEGKKIHLGNKHATAEEAHLKYVEAKRKYHTFNPEVKYNTGDTTLTLSENSVKFKVRTIDDFLEEVNGEKKISGKKIKSV